MRILVKGGKQIDVEEIARRMFVRNCGEYAGAAEIAGVWGEDSGVREFWIDQAEGVLRDFAELAVESVPAE